MEPDGAQAVIALLSTALRMPVTGIWNASASIQSAARKLSDMSVGDVRPFAVGDRRFLACRYHQQRGAVIIIGRDHEAADAGIEPDQHDSIEAIRLAARVLEHAVEAEERRIELIAQLEVTGRSVLAVTSELSLNVVLHRIVDLARELSGARYGALGVPDATGGLEAFLTSGMSPDQEARISHRPIGLGILGLLLREPRAIRLRNLADHPASVGFPANHPPMTSFLGMPIVSHGRVLGNLYLTEKRTADEFTENDTRLVEILARHAGVAIENAHLYQEIESQKRRLQLLVDQLPEAVLLAESDPDRITLANKQASYLLGWDIETPISLSAFLARNNRRQADGVAIIDEDVPMFRALHHGDVVNRQELQIERPDGRTISVLINSAPLLDDDGDILG
ncbi:MAG: GAF domain-containing protein, partial [Thermomicrobiales bacterium]